MRLWVIASLALACAHEKIPATVFIPESDAAPSPPPLECSSNDANACHVLGHRALATNPRNAFMFESTACEHGVAEACATVGWITLHGTWGEANAEGASLFLEHACQANILTSCVDLGVLERDARHDEAANAIFKKYCDREIASACDELGRMVEEGRGFAVDTRAAVLLYDHACRGGSAGGCGDFARSTHNAALLEIACRRHDGRACYELGLRAKNPSDENKQFERACNLGFSEGCVSLATLAPKDSTSVSWWLSRACDERNARACDTLGWHIGSTALHDRARALEK